MGDNLSGTVVK